ncbi:hypothetical protein LTR53_011520 [Teratosphaeriaceae sp. CCFEE 6253]|nr:hypothetical protein LTR53_011520 [Teratosphaeriaceae sp. CCFEE 6253]
MFAPAVLLAAVLAPGASAQTYKASFTMYGSGDSFGSPNCNTNTAACGFYTKPGYSAAVSQDLYGAALEQALAQRAEPAVCCLAPAHPLHSDRPADLTAGKLTIQTNSSGNKVSNAGNSIVVKVNNLCPANGNPLCAQSSTSATNQYGANVNFDTCKDSGASAALFGNSGVGLGVGTATKVDCSQWSGTIIH